MINQPGKWQWSLILCQKKPIAPLKFCPYAGRGFTLIELMITLTVLGLLVIVAVPAFRSMMMNNRLTSTSDAMVNYLNYARNIALNDAMSVKVCPLGALNSTTCGSDWNSGWIAVAQPVGKTPTLIKSQQNPASNPVTITSTAATVTFDTHGLAVTQTNFKFCDSRGAQYARSVMVLATGYVQSGTTPGYAVWNDGALSCP